MSRNISPVALAFLLLLLTWGCIMPARFKRMKNGQDTPFTLFLKGLPTAMAAIFPLIGLLTPAAAPYTRWILAGLLICLAGDVVLGIHFVTGGGLFLLGHVCYVAGLLGRQTLRPEHIILFAGIWGVLIVFLLLYRKHMPNRLMFLAVCLYAAALSALLAAAVPLPFTQGSHQAYCAAIGAILFVISDMTLCDNMLNNRPLRNQYISLGIYYTAQFLLGISTLAVL